MADTSLIIGNGNWAVKETSLLGYNIIQSKYVPIEMTVSRATTATRVNSAGLIELVPRNLLTYSEQFDNASWIKTNTTVTANTTTSPDGTTTADTITGIGALGVRLIQSNSISFTASTSYSLSVFAKKGTNDFIQLFVPLLIGGMHANFNINTGVVGTLGTQTGIPPTSSITNYGNGWYRCTINFTADAAASTVTSIGIVTSASAIRSEMNTLTTSLILWGAQLETGTTATEYFPTTDRFNIPRVDYSTGTASLLVEPARTNNVLYSEQFDNAYWTKVQGGIALAPVVTPNVETAPDGTMTADRVVFDLNGGTASGDLSSLGSANFTSISITRTQSVWIKTTDGTTKVFTFVSPTGAATTITVTSVYQRFTWTSTGINVSSVRLRLRGSAAGEGTATSATIAIWGAQYEDGSNATSYIPTVAGTVTRNADVISQTGISSLIGQTEGTLYAEVNLDNFEVNNVRIFAISDGTSANRIMLLTNSSNRITTIVSNSSVEQAQISSGTLTKGLYKIAVAYALNDFAFYINGALIGVDSSINVPICTDVYLGKIESSSPTAILNDRIELATLFKTRLTNAQLATLTTL